MTFPAEILSSDEHLILLLDNIYVENKYSMVNRGRPYKTHVAITNQRIIFASSRKFKSHLAFGTLWIKPIQNLYFSPQLNIDDGEEQILVKQLTVNDRSNQLHITTDHHSLGFTTTYILYVDNAPELVKLISEQTDFLIDRCVQ